MRTGYADYNVHRVMGRLMTAAATVAARPVHKLVGCPRCGASRGARCRNSESEAIDTIHVERNKRARDKYPVTPRKKADERTTT